MDTGDRSVSRTVLTYQAGRFSSCRRELAEEVSWTLTVNGQAAGSFSCSPWDTEETALGYLYLNGFIGQADEVFRLRVDSEQGAIEAQLKPQCAPAGCFPRTIFLKAAQVLELAAGLEASSGLYHRTGGVHSAALAREEQLLIYREDVSRHGALEKVAGACLKEGIPTQGAALVFSGRVAGEIVRMAAVMGCAAIIARSAPTDLACRLAEKKGITLIGFAREDGFNIYTCPERISL